MILLTRKADFAAAHFYWNDAWSEEENLRVFGKCSNRQGHGHNYTLEVTVKGNIDPTSGFVVDLKLLKDVMESEVISVYDHRHLNYEVPEFNTTLQHAGMQHAGMQHAGMRLAGMQPAGVQPTAENIAIAIWRRLDGKIPNAKLQRVRVYEMADLFADFYGEGA